MTNISQIMKQAKAMQEKMAEVQKKVEETEVEGSSGGGAVKITINGKHIVKKVSIDPKLVDKEEIEVLEDLIGIISIYLALNPEENLVHQIGDPKKE